MLEGGWVPRCLLGKERECGAEGFQGNALCYESVWKRYREALWAGKQQAGGSGAVTGARWRLACTRRRCRCAPGPSCSRRSPSTSLRLKSCPACWFAARRTWRRRIAARSQADPGFSWSHWSRRSCWCAARWKLRQRSAASRSSPPRPCSSGSWSRCQAKSKSGSSRSSVPPGSGFGRSWSGSLSFFRLCC